MASLVEIQEAYQQAKRERNDADVVYWERLLRERLVMVCDSIGDSSRVSGTNRN